MEPGQMINLSPGKNILNPHNENHYQNNSDDDQGPTDEQISKCALRILIQEPEGFLRPWLYIDTKIPSVTNFISNIKLKNQITYSEYNGFLIEGTSYKEFEDPQQEIQPWQKYSTIIICEVIKYPKWDNLIIYGFECQQKDTQTVMRRVKSFPLQNCIMETKNVYGNDAIEFEEPIFRGIISLFRAYLHLSLTDKYYIKFESEDSLQKERINNNSDIKFILFVLCHAIDEEDVKNCIGNVIREVYGSIDKNIEERFDGFLDFFIVKICFNTGGEEFSEQELEVIRRKDLLYEEMMEQNQEEQSEQQERSISDLDVSYSVKTQEDEENEENEVLQGTKEIGLDLE